MKKYGLIGYPGIDAEYVNFEIPHISDLPGIVAGNPNLVGLNVTIPYKEQVISYLDELDEAAAAIGAVNVIRIERNHGKTRLVGYNSDVIGFTQSIESLLEPHHKKALILGTGGASKAIHYGLQQLGLESLFVSRSRSNDNTITYDDLTPEIMKEYKVIVNCTPVGMYPKADEALYNPNTTLFMKKGSDHGAIVKNGLEMLLLQAFGAWDIWNR